MYSVGNFKGTTTLCITTFGITTFGKMMFSIRAKNETLSITTLILTFNAYGLC